MDPITQGVLGASASQSVANSNNKRKAAALGFLAGMAADLDVLIRSDTDPLLALEYHRHFTHSLIFIPIGALVCAVVFSSFLRWRAKSKKVNPTLGFKQIYIFSLAGYATHALLDACTTYGTQLLWPFSDMRVAWNTVSVVDPAFTLPLVALLLFAVSRANKARSRMASLLPLIYVVSYLGFGLVQNDRAKVAAYQLANNRGHIPMNLGVKPSFANILVWKSVYQYEGRYYVDAIRTGQSIQIIEGTSTQKLDVPRHFPWLDKNSQQAKDLQRFAWFSNQHLALDPTNPLKVLDIRYSQLPNRLDGMWGILLDPNAARYQHVEWVTSRPDPKETRDSVGVLWSMVQGEHVHLRDLNIGHDGTELQGD